MKKKILVTGGAGYIGSHVCVELLQKDYGICVVDNFSNSSEEALKRVKAITKKDFDYFNIDLRDKVNLEKVLKKNSIDSVIHFAGLKAVGESVDKPLEYYENNVGGTINLLGLMKEHGIMKIVFSSSACVYGDPHKVPITEGFPVKPTNPYGQTKAMIEQILKDVHIADPKFKAVILRYFNPVGAHKSGLIGEDPRNIPNNLVPYISQVAIGKLKVLNIYGNNYKTPDGTGVRDYIHITDLAKGHLKALEKLKSGVGLAVYNLGTGKGYSVLQVISAFEKASGKKVPYKIAARRQGDVAQVFTDPSLARKELGFKANLDMFQMCKDVWRWQSMNPNGYSL